MGYCGRYIRLHDAGTSKTERQVLGTRHAAFFLRFTRLGPRAMPSTTHITDNILANSKAVLDIVSAAPAPILGPVLSAVTKVITEVEAVRALKESCITLAERAITIVASIHVAISNQPTLSTLSVINLKKLCETLLQISSLMSYWANISWFMRMLKRFSIRHEIQNHTLLLEDAFKVFQIQETLNIAAALQILRREVQVIASQPNVPEMQEISPKKLLQYSQVLTPTEIHDEQDMNAKEFHFGSIASGTCNNRFIICKRYKYDCSESKREFEREKESLMVLRHPGIIQFMGSSPPGYPQPYIVLSGSQEGNAIHILRSRLHQGTASESFMAALFVLRGVSSALRYIGTSFQLRGLELDEFAKVSNFLLSPSGCPVLGRNIIIKAPDKGKPRQEQLDRLFKIFYTLVEQLLFDDKPVFPFESWSAVGERRPLAHLRPLLRLATWDPAVDFANMVQRILDLSDFLGAKGWTKSIPFPTIRQGLLSVEGLQHFMYIRPRQPWTVKLFDIGYVKQGTFICLLNAQEKYGPLNMLISEDKEILTLPTVQDQDVMTLSGNIIRYTFRDTNNASIQRRLNGYMLSDSVEATSLLLKLAPVVIREYGESHGVKPSDLILVCGTIDHPSGAGIAFDSTSPEEVYFYKLPVNSQPWGFWSLCDRPEAGVYHHSIQLQGARTYYTTTPQSIAFIQLQDQDFP